ncbi:MAG: CDP-alcohol phosphatidyltransferase family protein [Actinomycetales bacterium]|nr:CDP-alcohol phosphatidyltransferase family protein [Actinomycetales bacterium]
MLNNPSARRLASGVIDPPARLLLRLRVSPDVVTVIGTVGASAAAIACFSTGRFILGVVLISFFALSDLIDGAMARMAGTSGPWGNFLDATLDRIVDGAIFGSLIAWGAINGQAWVAAAATFALVTGQVTSYAKARAEAVGARANVGIAERAERTMGVLLAVLLTGLGVPFVLPIALWLLGLLGIVTIIQRIAVVRSQLRS